VCKQLDLRFVTPVDHLSPSSSVLCCCSVFLKLYQKPVIHILFSESVSSTYTDLKLLSLIFTARRYVSAVLAVIACPSVCPSVCLSVTSQSCTKMAKPRIRLTMLYDSPETLVFRCQKSWRNSNDITPNGGAKRGGVGS